MAERGRTWTDSEISLDRSLLTVWSEKTIQGELLSSGKRNSKVYQKMIAELKKAGHDRFATIAVETTQISWVRLNSSILRL